MESVLVVLSREEWSDRVEDQEAMVSEGGRGCQGSFGDHGRKVVRGIYYGNVSESVEDVLNHKAVHVPLLDYELV